MRGTDKNKKVGVKGDGDGDVAWTGFGVNWLQTPDIFLSFKKSHGCRAGKSPRPSILLLRLGRGWLSIRWSFLVDSQPVSR